MGGPKSPRLTELTPPKNNNIFFRYSVRNKSRAIYRSIIE
jgi:hypothetical protein